jgi:hypothetical protein
MAKSWLIVGSRPLCRHTDNLTARTIRPQEDPRFHVPQQFLNDYLDLIRRYVTGMNLILVDNIDKTRCLDWEKRRSHEGIVPVELADGPSHFGVSRRIKCQTMPGCISASGETLWPLIVTTGPSKTGVFRDGMEEGVYLKAQIARSAYVDATVFQDYLSDVLIPKIAEFREASIMPGEPTVLLMENCSAHPSSAVIQLLSRYRVKAIAFLPRTSGIF